MVKLCLRPWAAPPEQKAMTLIHAALVGADSINDCDVPRSGATKAVLPHKVMAPSTLGTFLRSMRFGNVRFLRRPGSRLPEAGSWFRHTGERGLHLLLATRADTGEILGTRLRKGSATPSADRAFRSGTDPEGESRRDHRRDPGSG